MNKPIYETVEYTFIIKSRIYNSVIEDISHRNNVSCKSKTHQKVMKIVKFEDLPKRYIFTQTKI